MTPSIQQLVCLFTIMTVVYTGLASALHVEISPQTVNELITREVTITCVVNDSPSWSQTVILVDLGKKGQHPLVNLRESNNIQYGPEMKKNMKADGNINGVNRTESFLKITIQNPSVEDGGVYSCLMFFLDSNGELKEARDEANMTVDNNNDKLVIKHLLEKVSKLEKIAERQGEELQGEHEQTELLKEQATKQDEQATKQDEQIKQLKEQAKTQDEQAKKQDEQAKKQDEEIKQLKEQAKRQEAKVSSKFNELMATDRNQSNVIEALTDKVSSKFNELMATDRNQSNVIEALTDKDSFTCAFSAGYNAKDTLADGNTLVFSVPILDVGNDYNTTTGIFTAPKKGLYVFDLTVRVNGADNMVFVDLKANDVTVASVYARDLNQQDQSSVGIVVSLQAGGQVRPVVIGYSGNNYLNEYYRNTIFSGYLMKMT